MSRQNERERESSSAYDAASDPHYQYRWSYEGQRTYDEARKQRQGRRGAVLYAVTMAVAFLCCFAILIGVLAIYEEQAPGVGGASVADVAEAMLPSTVLVTGATDEGYSYGSGFFVREDG